MNIKKDILKCSTCNEKMMYLNHEKILIPLIFEMSPVGVDGTAKAVNLHLYCKKCRCNFSKPMQYIDEKCISPFIEDVKKHSAKFDKQEYIQL